MKHYFLPHLAMRASYQMSHSLDMTGGPCGYSAMQGIIGGKMDCELVFHPTPRDHEFFYHALHALEDGKWICIGSKTDPNMVLMHPKEAERRYRLCRVFQNSGLEALEGVVTAYEGPLCKNSPHLTRRKI